ncbi:O-antigen polymerase [Leifsonia sp. F6_8S_P_1B]|uniref:O-antigen polymerase n=1 Tax=Leifsonia williamsii TaxID=3035919 RepID=A0ABT8KFC8_9MICO|nr:O-antigen polymerase [Leifsonia williamsii]MDN4616151.1 O-antigen polymerase [Leifsonia williamsii]
MMSNLTWCLILLAVLAILTFLVHRYARTVFVLVLCHNVVWAGALALIATNLIRYRPATAGAWLTLGAGIVAFDIGAAAVALLLARRRERPSQPRWGAWRAQQTTFAATRPVFYVASALYALGFAVYLVSVHLRFGIGTLLLHPAAIRSAHGTSYLETVPLPARILLYLGPLLFVLLVYRAGLDRPFPIAVRIVGALALAASMLALLQRSNIVIAVLLWVAVLVSQRWSSRSDAAAAPRRGLARYWQRLPRAVQVIAGVAVLGLGALIVFQGVGGALNKVGQESLRSGVVAPALARSGLTSPFQYYTAAPMAFLQLAGSENHDWPPERVRGVFVVGDWNPQTWGASTFGSVLKVVPGAPHVDAISPFINTGVPTNVYTWMEPFYRDFRLPGVIVGTLLLGALFGWLFVARFRSQTVFWISAVCMTTVFLAPFATRIGSTLILSLIVFAAAITLVSRWLTARRTAAAPEPLEEPVP